MNRMIGTDDYNLALDAKGQIGQQYLVKNREGTLGHHFIIQMAAKGKTVIIPWRNLNDSIRAKLEEKGFTRNDEDYKYVICASGTCCNKLVSHDPHFSGVKHILAKIPVHVLFPD